MGENGGNEEEKETKRSVSLGKVEEDLRKSS